MRKRHRLAAVPTLAKPAVQTPVQRTPIGGDSLENHDRAIYQSARHKAGSPVPPLPLTEAQAWAEAAAITLKERTTHG